jgi:S-methylmethionine-dependent homocysteine/selenocysteine methylase
MNPTYNFTACYEQYPLILTEGAVGLRMQHEYGIQPWKNVQVAGLVCEDESRAALAMIYSEYLQVAQEYSLPILLMTNTRRANRERAEKDCLANKNVMADYARFLRELSQNFTCPTYIGGTIGSKGDGYTGEGVLTTEGAVGFHSWQMERFEQSDIDFIFVALMPSVAETIGIASLAAQTELPYIVSFMVYRNGKLPDGYTIHKAIEMIDESVAKKPLCYMCNCVHPQILLEALAQPDNQTALVKERFHGIQANAACADPRKLEQSCAVLSSSSHELAESITRLTSTIDLKICGGCCGTDNEHLRAMAMKLNGAKEALRTVY